MRKMMIFGSMVLSLLGLAPYGFAGNRAIVGRAVAPA
jgi:hypothetical protein